MSKYTKSASQLGKKTCFFLDEVFISMTKMDFHQFYCSEMLMIML